MLPIVAVSCNKQNESVRESTRSTDSVTMQEQTQVQTTADSAAIKDSIINNAPATKEVLRTGVMRDVTANTITREADAEQLPFSIGEEFTEQGQRFVLKIKNLKPGQITATVTPADESQNIRIEQIQLPDGSMDGPFSSKMTKKLPEGGEVSLIIGSDMASETGKGRFTVHVEAH